MEQQLGISIRTQALSAEMSSGWARGGDGLGDIVGEGSTLVGGVVLEQCLHETGIDHTVNHSTTTDMKGKRECGMPKYL